ncbi:MAG: Rrf2 family transcriptional regulator [Thermoguttaceae bacterium]|nr:Rrf2 family transcriptional regulator [Thermoguttaceae bacterium]MDW8038150.1 Rrf2 family transcriptional regulator [Thermoguttaceae bacterium]
MKISAKTEYACIAVLDLASRYGAGEPVRVREIAARHRVPSRFLVQILLQLKGAGLVASTRGASGGYQLLRSPEQLSLGEVIEVIEGTPTEQDSMTASWSDSPAVKALQEVWAQLSQAQRRMLREISFAQLLEKAKTYDHQMYYI